MPQTTDPKLDPRFRALEAIPEAVLPEFSGTVDTEISSPPQPQGSYYSAFVLLAPGAVLPSLPFRRVVQLLDDTYIIGAEFSALSVLAARPEVVYVEAPRPADVDLVDSVAATKADQNWVKPTPFTGKDIIIGIVDFGLDFTLDDFKDTNGTRILSIWDQGLNPGSGERSPVNFGYGVEYSKPAIDLALTGPNPFAAVRHVPRAGAHGTHVTGIAAGNGNSTGTHKGVAYEADIIFVQPTTQGQPITSSDRVAEGIKYIFMRLAPAKSL